MQMSPLYPSMTEWVADYDPITSLGDANWTVMFWRASSTSMQTFTAVHMMCPNDWQFLFCFLLQVTPSPRPSTSLCEFKWLLQPPNPLLAIPA